MNYTAEQRQAIETHDRNVIVIAGAGSGKTRVLVDRFVALLEANLHWPLPSLVAITFTEKAAREMRDRVRQAIESRIESCNSDLRPFWRTHQAALDGARIGTIHALCGMLLRANAASLEIDPGFTTLDESESAILRDEAIEQALGDLLGTPGEALFEHYDTRTIWNTVRGLMSADLTPTSDSSSPSPQAERGLGGEANLLDHWWALYEKNALDCLQTLRADQDFIAALRWQPNPPCSDDSDKMFLIWQQVNERMPRLLGDDPQEVLSALTECASGINLQGGKQAVWGGQSGLKAAKDILRFIRDFAANTLEQIGQPPGEADELAAELVPHWIAAIQSAQALYREAKDKQRALDFNDLEHFARVLLQDAKVQARYRGVEFNHVLVDEFQDTNAAQRDIIYALSGLERPGSLFVVGDPKQSIYAFRGADVSVFEQVRREIVDSGGTEIALNTSFRAHRALVDGLNAVFSQLLVKPENGAHDYTVDYGLPMIAQRASTEHHAPAFDVIILDKEHAPKTEQAADSMRRWEAHALANRIKELKADGWPVWDKTTDIYRPIQFGDFAVLFQSAAQMTLVEGIFKTENVPYVTIAGKGYYSRPEVWDLLNLLKALYNPADELSLASVLRSPLYNLSDDALYALRLITLPDPIEPEAADTVTKRSKKRMMPLWDALMDDSLTDLPDMAQIRFARGSLSSLRQIAGRVTIAELLSRAIEDTAFMATLTGLPDGARRCGNVEKLLDVARRSKRVSLGDFTAYLQDLSERETREGEAPVETEGVVKLMTVHASKGLEFPVVVLFDATWQHGGNNDKDLLLIDPVTRPVCKVPGEDGGRVKPFAWQLAARYAEAREAAERLRLFYVGATRAQDRLIITGHDVKKEGTWLRQLQDVLHLSVGVDESTLLEQEWGSVKVTTPRTPPDPERRAQSRPVAAWDTLENVSAEPLEPPLLNRVPTDRRAPTRILNASDVALLGEAHAQDAPRAKAFARFRHYVLRDAPSQIRDVSEAQTAADLSISPRIIGEMVHKALQWQHTSGDLAAKLRTYAWEQGLTDMRKVEYAVLEAAELLRTTENNAFMKRIQQAVRVYRELPFTLQFEGRTIHGQIDVLYRDRYGKWTVLDYKTDQIEEQFAHSHSRRYHMQLGLYAAAVEELTGQAPNVVLHYIRPNVTIPIAESLWRSALATLGSNIDAALLDEQLTGDSP